MLASPIRGLPSSPKNFGQRTCQQAGRQHAYRWYHPRHHRTATCQYGHVDRKWRTYHLIAANHRHNTERLDVVCSGIKGRVVRRLALITKDYVRNIVGVQVVHMTAGDIRVTLHKALPSSLGLLVKRIAAAAAAITINVHVREGTPIAMKIGCTGLMIPAVCECCGVSMTEYKRRPWQFSDFGAYISTRRRCCRSHPEGLCRRCIFHS
jgi:hypothetical protein